MGGHGYSAYSKMAAIYASNDVNNTWEGENHILIQQTTKFIIENYQKAMTGKTIDSPLLQFFSDVSFIIFSHLRKRRFNLIDNFSSILIKLNYI